MAFTYVPHQKRLVQGEKKENTSRIRMDVITPPPHPPTPPPHQCTAPAREHKKEKTKGAFAWTSSPLHPSNRAEREMQVQAGMCRKSRVGENTVKTDAKCRGQHGFAQCSPAGWDTFCYKTPQKPMRKQKQSSIPREQSAKTRVSAHASKGIAPPHTAADATAANNNNNKSNNNNHNQGNVGFLRTTTTTKVT